MSEYLDALQALATLGKQAGINDNAINALVNVHSRDCDQCHRYYEQYAMKEDPDCIGVLMMAAYLRHRETP